MPRRRRQGVPGPATAAAQLDDSNGAEGRNERTAVFERTKMCKFYILGVCAKATACRFAHDPSELQALPDLQRTKLCKVLITTGSCDNPECRYAHNKEELRALPHADEEYDLQKQQLQQLHMQLQHQLHGMGDAGMHDSSAFMGLDPNQSQEAMGPSMQAAMLQMGHAAQAHAAEAARLQAMASQLKAMVGNVPSNAGFGANNYWQGPVNGTQGWGFDQSEGQRLMVKNTFLDFTEPGTPVAPLRMVHSAAGRLCSMGGEENTPGAEDEGPLVTAMSRALAGEPVQIRPDTLRSLSSNSLTGLAGLDPLLEDDELDGLVPTSPKPTQLPSSYAGSANSPKQPSSTSPMMAPLPEPSSGAYELRRVNSRVDKHRSMNSLASIGELHEDENWRLHDQSLHDDEATMHSSSPSRTAMPQTFDAAPGPEAPRTAGQPLQEGLFTRGGQVFADTAIGGHLQSALAEAVGGFTVKNTFLDFASNEPVAGLRAVQTAAGRLDLWSQDWGE